MNRILKDGHGVSPQGADLIRLPSGSGVFGRCLAAVGGLAVLGQAYAVSFVMPVSNTTIIPADAVSVVDIELTNDSVSPISLFGFTFVLEIGDGTAGPQIDNIDLIGAGLLFDGASQSDVLGSDSRTAAATAFSIANDVIVPAETTITLAQVALDATGIAEGTYSISFQEANSLNQDTLLVGDSVPTISLNDGLITVVPEPRSIFVSVLCVLLGVGRWVTKRQSAAQVA